MPRVNPRPDQHLSTTINRRQLFSLGVSAAVLPTLSFHANRAVGSDIEHPASTANLVDLIVNGHRQQMMLDSRVTLLDALRDHLQLTGTKKGCDHGQCGACTVLCGGHRVLSCLTLAASVTEPVVTIEGLSQPGEALHPMQQAFIDADAFQCGYCTPGQILSAIACVEEGHAETETDIREYMSGNLCRCAAYPNIVKAITQAKPAISKV